jgi:ABC-type Fe3+/spermidine/putrescine transport system ATPase subunit
MDGGRIAQLGTPQQVYQEPDNEFVADFLGVANLMDVECLPGSGRTRAVRFGDFTLEARAPDGFAAGPGRAVIRPECVGLDEPGCPGGNRVPGMVDRAVFLGSTTQVRVRLPHGAVVQSLVTNASVQRGLTSGQAVSVHLPADALRVLSTSASAPAEVPAKV